MYPRTAGCVARPAKNATLAEFVVTRRVSEGLRFEGIPRILPRSRVGLPCYIFFRTGHTVAFLAAIHVALVATLHAQTSLPILPPTSSAAPLEEKLEKRVTITVDNDMTLEQLADYLRTQFQMNVVLDERALDEVGLGSDTPIAGLHLKGVPLEEALLMILEQLELTFILRDVGLVMTTPERAEEHLDVHVYPVADLIFWEQDSVRGRYFADYDTLIDAITSSIAPDTWDEVGGAGSIEAYPISQSLVIGQSRQVHTRIRALIRTLRRAKQMQPAPTRHPQSTGAVGSVPYTSGSTSAGRGWPRRAYRQGGFF